MNRLADQIRKYYTVVDTSVSGDSEGLTIEENGENFTVIAEARSLTIYRSFKDVGGHGWCFLPGSRTGKSLKTVSSFINARLKRKALEQR